MGKGQMTKEILMPRNLIAIIDDEDYEWAKDYTWWSNVRNLYVMTRKHKKDKWLYLHRMIMEKLNGDITGKCVDHINGNPLDNRRCNLRVCTHTQNMQNMGKFTDNTHSQYKGVSYLVNTQKRRKRWLAYIEVNKKRKYLGYFHTEEDAAIAYNLAAKEHYGEFARLNEIKRA